jgi:hypothetical protein
MLAGETARMKRLRDRRREKCRMCTTVGRDPAEKISKVSEPDFTLRRHIRRAHEPHQAQESADRHAGLDEL